MKIAISVNQPESSAPLERRFGRCRYFLLVDPTTRTWEAEANPAAEASGGAGTQAAQFLSKRGVKTVLSGDFGPNAFTALHAANIDMYSAKGGVADILLEKFLTGGLKKVSKSTSRQRHGGKR